MTSDNVDPYKRVSILKDTETTQRGGTDAVDIGSINPGDVVNVGNDAIAQHSFQKVTEISAGVFTHNGSVGRWDVGIITAHYIPWQRHEAIVAEMKAENADLRKQLADDQEMLTIAYMIGSQNGENGVKGQSDD